MAGASYNACRMERSTVDELAKVAYELAEEIRDGRWRHINALRTMPAAAVPEVLAELQRRMPGFSTPEYATAIAKGMFASR